ncbi:UDP-N-acetylmuramoyl-tripeptide--D-alanyl-D-alanine ligase [Candidatus Uhrbacteria bacterium]|nr:UDP-N-acetylmuramoyl-tripeptide--D-alanyl-D-alanine ligase [Candidatus Uhrbacteria bacterium]
MKKFLVSKLQSAAKRAIEQHKPIIVAVTGSFGKTSTKDAVATVLRTKYKVRTAEKNYNNEIGVPLTILGMKSPGRSSIGWLSLLWRARRLKEMPEVLVLEFGADHPGDIKALCELAPPKIGVVTGVSPVHAEYFADLDALTTEKAHLVRVLKGKGVGLAVLNGDDPRVSAMADETKADVLRYGAGELSDVRATNIALSTRLDDDFDIGEVFSITTASVEVGGHTVGSLRLENAIGYAPVLTCLAALTVGDYLNVSMSDSIDALNKDIHALPGRLRPLAGIKGSLIIDDSYNAAPAAMQHGLDVLKQFQPGEKVDRRIAVLGQMAELGAYDEQEHRFVGMKVPECADIFIGVGDRMGIAIDAAKEAGMDANAVHIFGNSEDAGRFLDGIIQQGDVVYVKGSQSSRMEKVVKDVMAEPGRANELLVRQDGKWLNT